MQHTVWTIGHSTRSFDEFLHLLQNSEIACVADVRTHPGSRKFPHFGQDALAASLRAHGIEYQWVKELGGRRRPEPGSTNTVWRNESFRGYADYMETAAFKAAANQLLQLSDKTRTALMCAEAVWWRCHRSMIADYLCVQGVRVVHILDVDKHTIHPMTKPARIVEGRLSYATTDTQPDLPGMATE